MESQGTLNSQNNLKKSKVKGLTLPEFKTCYKAIIIRTVLYWHKDRPIDQWTRIETLEINSDIYDRMIFEKGVKTIQ